MSHRIKKIKDFFANLSKKYIILLCVLVFLISTGVFFVFHKKIPPYDQLTKSLNARNYSAVIQDGQSYLKNNEQDEKLAIIMARAYFGFGVASGKRDEYARLALETLGKVSQKSVILLITKGYIYFSVHNFDGARLAYQEALVLDQKNIEAMVKLAQVYEAEKNIGEALKLYKKVLELNPGNHEAIIGYLRIKVIYKEYDFAFSKATELLKYARDNDFIASLSELLATEYGRRKDFDNAQKMYEQVLSKQPMRIASLVGLADVMVKTIYKKLLQEGNTLESLTVEPEKLAKKAIEIDKDFIYAYLVLLDIERLRGNTEEAKQYESIARKLFQSQKFLASEKELIQTRLKVLPKAKVTVTK